MNEDDKMIFNENDPFFGQKTRMQETKKMGGLQGKLVALIMKISGGQVNESQATYIILGAIAIMFIISFILFSNALS